MPEPQPRIETTADRQFGTNSYLVEDEATRDAVVIDANLEPDLMVDLARQRGVAIRAILLTHTDIDHIAGLSRLREAFGDVPIAVHESEREVVAAGVPLRKEFPRGLQAFANVDALVPGETYQAGSLAFEVIHTPGHSPGGVTLRLDGVLFTGDALFAGTVGRSDLANSDSRALIEGIRERLMTLPDELVVYAGHGPVTTIGQERRYNRFL